MPFFDLPVLHIQARSVALPNLVSTTPHIIPSAPWNDALECLLRDGFGRDPRLTALPWHFPCLTNLICTPVFPNVHFMWPLNTPPKDLLRGAGSQLSRSPEGSRSLSPTSLIIALPCFVESSTTSIWSRRPKS